MKLTDAPPRVGAADVAALRAAGLDDDAINDLVQVVAYFNYINRIAEGLGVDPETFLDDSGVARGDEDADDDAPRVG